MLSRKYPNSDIAKLSGEFIEAMWDLFLKCQGFSKTVLTNLVTMGIQETEKS
ncbi:MAG: hypothetical protein HRU34_09590 [Richelia sp.]|nr:hypothetical protein [Richelia sp.]CDN13240.1 hypothetical protein RintRC_2853 [Richelia intracellularis]